MFGGGGGGGLWSSLVLYGIIYLYIRHNIPPGF